MRRWLAAAAAVGALCACNPVAPKASPSPSTMPSAQATAGLALHITGEGTPSKPIHFFGQQADNRVEYELVADRVESSGAAGKARAVFSNARITFHDKNGTKFAAQAPQAIYDQVQNTLTLLGGVTGRGANGMTLSCRQLTYDHRDQMLHGTGDVTISDPKGFRGTGSRFDSDISLTHYRMQ